MDPIEAGLRPLAEPPPLPTEGEPRLVERIRAEIDRDGPLTFDRFMAMALYEPGLGYYRTSDDRATRAGDFLTAPETHPIFGAAIARQLDEVHRRLGAPGRFVVRDYGAGSGALGLSILEAVTGRGVLGRVAGSTDLAAALVYVPIEVDRERRDAIVERLTARGLRTQPRAGPPARPSGERRDAGERVPRCPAGPSRGRADRTASASWRSAGRRGRFVEVEIAPSSPALEARLAADGVVLADGARAEICLELDRWIGELAAGLERGIGLVDRLRPRGVRAVRTRAVRRDAAGLRGPARPRRLVDRGRAPGPDRPRRLQRRRPGGAGARSDRPRPDEPGRVPRRSSASIRSSMRSDPIRPRRSRSGWRFARPSGACSTRGRSAASRWRVLGRGLAAEPVLARPVVPPPGLTDRPPGPTVGGSVGYVIRPIVRRPGQGARWRRRGATRIPATRARRGPLPRRSSPHDVRLGGRSSAVPVASACAKAAAGRM